MGREEAAHDAPDWTPRPLPRLKPPRRVYASEDLQAQCARGDSDTPGERRLQRGLETGRVSRQQRRRRKTGALVLQGLLACNGEEAARAHLQAPGAPRVLSPVFKPRGSRGEGDGQEVETEAG